MTSIIISPHADDEIIGNFEILTNAFSVIIYTEIISNLRKDEALKLKDYFSIEQIFSDAIPEKLLSKENIFYFPDPIYEIHPAHRHQGHIGEQLAREGYEVIFYSTNMNTPYIHEVVSPYNKECALNLLYPSQKDLWLYEKKYILFEGRCKWIF